VRYRTFGGWVTTSASIWSTENALRTSASLDVDMALECVDMT
jgi:hypothetical protein